MTFSFVMERTVVVMRKILTDFGTKENWTCVGLHVFWTFKSVFCRVVINALYLFTQKEGKLKQITDLKS